MKKRFLAEVKVLSLGVPICPLFFSGRELEQQMPYYAHPQTLNPNPYQPMAVTKEKPLSGSVFEGGEMTQRPGFARTSGHKAPFGSTRPVELDCSVLC